MLASWSERLLGSRPRQPDQRSCGAACLVVERALRDPAYAELLVAGTHPVTGSVRPGSVTDRFAEEVLAMHRRTTGPVSAAGRLQLPWTRLLGTPPWAVLGQLSGPASSYALRWLWTRAARTEAATAIAGALAAGRPVPVYVGSRLLPRHVVLVTRADEQGLWVYDPAVGRLRPVPRRAWLDATIDLGRWTRPWWAITPRRCAPGPARRSRA